MLFELPGHCPLLPHSLGRLLPFFLLQFQPHQWFLETMSTMMGKAGYFHPNVASVCPSPSQEPLAPSPFPGSILPTIDCLRA